MHRTTTICVLLLTGMALADVKVQTVTRVSLLAGLGTTEVTAGEMYQGDKKAADQSTRIVGGIAGALSKGAQTTVQITRLDKDVIWDLDPKAKTYTENPIKPLTREELTGAKVETEQSGPKEKSDYRVAKSELKVEKTGQTKTVNGFACTEYLMTWDVVLEDSAAKQKVNQVMTTDLWTTPLTDDLEKAKAAQDEFNRAYAKKLGAEMDAAQMQEMGSAMLASMYGVDSREAATGLAKVSAEMQKVEGYPIVTEVTWQLKPDSASAAAAKPEPKEEEEERPTSIVNALSQKVAKAIVKEPKEPAKKDVLFSSHMEVKSVATAEIPAANFEIPEGFKKVEKK